MAIEAELLGNVRITLACRCRQDRFGTIDQLLRTRLAADETLEHNLLSVAQCERTRLGTWHGHPS
jgi:hypothetical protein